MKASTTIFGSTVKVCNWLRLTTSTEAPSRFRPRSKGLSGVAPVGHHVPHPVQFSPVPAEHRRSAGPVSAVSVLHAPGVHDAEAGLLCPSIALPGRANQFFRAYPNSRWNLAVPFREAGLRLRLY